MTTPMPDNTPTPRRLADCPIAIVGMSALFPGAPDLEHYWDNILKKVDSIIEVPESHWEIADYYDKDASAPDKTYSQHGGFIPEVDFDPMEFGIPPNLLEQTDSSQLLGLLVARTALEDAGYIEATAALRERTGVILGVTAGMKLLGSLNSRLQYPIWEQVLRKSGLSEDETTKVVEKLKAAYVKWEEASFPGLLGNVIAGRIANRLDLGGTNCTVDAACGSSLAAMKMSVNDLVDGRADMMITGGVDTDNSPFMYMCFSKTPAFTKDDRVRPFDAESKGILIGEGLGMVVLKRLADAERDGDQIYAVLKGIGSSSDGRFKSIYAPRASGQARCLRRAYEDAGVAPNSIGLIEAHGTGTAAGDVTEFEGLREVYSAAAVPAQSVALGSIKSQIGHTKATAGAAGLIKTALALHHKVLPPLINLEQPNPKLDVANSPLYLNSETRPWITTGAPRRAGVSSFGFGGTNFHFVLEEYQAAQTQAFRMQSTPKLVLVSAESPDALKARCQELVGRLGGDEGEQAFRELATASVEQQPAQAHARLGFVAENATAAADALQTALTTFEKKPEDEAWSLKGIAFRKQGMDPKGKVVALFSGQGSQYLNMGRELFLNFPPLLEPYGQINTRFQDSGQTPISQIVFPPPAFDDDTKQAQDSALQLTQHAQPSLGGFSAGLFKLLKAAGFQADFTAGHSFGELTALWAGGVISEEDYYTLAYARGQAMKAPDDPDFDAGTMMAVMGKLENLEDDLKEFPDVVMANLNSPKQMVVAGPKAVVQDAHAALKAKKYNAVLLPVSAAFHTPLVGHAQKPFAKAIRAVKFQKPQIPVFSNTTAKAYPDDPKAIQQQLEEHILNSVRFREEIENLHEAGGRVFVEFGPKNVLTKLTEAVLSGKDFSAVALNDSPKKNSDQQFRQAVAQLCVLGLPLQGYDPYGWERTKPKRKRSPLTMPMSGANYVSAATRKAFDDAMNDGFQIKSGGSGSGNAPATPSAMPGRFTPPPSSMAAAPAQPKPATVATPSSSAAPSVSPSPVSMTQPTTPMTVSSVAPSGVDAAGIYQYQQSALQVHQQYLQQQGEYSRTVLQLLQQQLQLVSQGQAIPEPVSQSMQWFHAHQGETLRVHEQYLQQQAEQMRAITGTAPLASPVAPVAAPVAISAPQPQLMPVAPAPMAAPPMMPQPTIPAPQVTTASAPAQLPSATPVAPAEPAEDVESVLLSVVAEKTGYPREMLEAGMDLEADLGVDSIKRVEILGTLQDKMPALPTIRGEELGELRTLAQITDYLKNQLPETSAGVPPHATDAQSTTDFSLPQRGARGDSNSAQTPVSSNSAQDVESVLLGVVAEKTGYPREMLEAGMDLEADLGVDSIKRVEILGTLQDQIPELPTIRGEELGELRTLAQITDYLKNQLPETSAGVPPRASEVPAPEADVSGGSDPAAALQAVISEKTGYPVEMLELGMELEADLGVDSIKRVEIMWAIQEKFPELPPINNAEVAELRTLQQITDHLQANLSKAPINGGEATNGSGEDSSNGHTVFQPDVETLSSNLLAIIAEKTGYPTDMLELSMDLEADLGVDSIKRVEIMWAVQEKFPVLPQLNNSELGELRTLQQIIDRLATELPGLPTAALAASPATAQKKNL